MNARWTRTLRSLTILLLVLLITAVGVASAQVPPPPLTDQSRRSDAATLVAYSCTFDAAANAVRIAAGLAGGDARPIPATSYTLSAQISAEQGAIDRERIQVEAVTTRDPMRFVIVFDATDTMPLTEIVRAFAAFADELDPNDQAAVITFSSDISPTSQFYSDMNRLVTENLINAEVRPGDNRLYDAILEGVNVFTGGVEQRQAVLVITDSGRRETDQTPAEDIIARAQQLGVQIYPIAFFYEDAPDTAELLRIADQTGGYGWVYDAERSRIAVGSAVTDYLNQFLRLINSEVVINIDLNGVELPTDLSRGLPIELVIDSANERTLSAQINCPVRTLSHSIRFTNIEDSDVLNVPINVTVSTQSETDLSQAEVAFFLNDVVVRTTPERFYRLDVPSLAPGEYTLRADLLGRTGQLLASTPTIRVYVQQAIRLTTLEVGQSDLAGEIDFQAIVDLNVNLPDVQFRIGRSDTPGQSQPLGEGVAPVGEDGRAILTVPDIGEEVDRIFPDYNGRSYIVSAFVPGSTPEDPLLAISEPLAITVSDAPPRGIVGTSVGGGTAGAIGVIGATGARDWTSWLYGPFTLPIATIVGLLVLNILLFRQVGRSRIRRMIHVQDGHELSDRLMAITVRRAGVVKTHPLTKKTVYIGRGSQNDVNVGDDVQISRQHGVVMWRKEDWYYANRNPRIVTKINGKRYRGYILHRLEPITEITIGSTHLYFHSNAQQDISELTKTNI